jgi:chemotaxis-related protein WspD
VDLRTCWSEIGVQGDGSCPRLQEFIHCRNCPVYSNAGVQLLNRPLPPDYRREWTEHFARKKKTAAPARISAVLFRIESEWLALPTPAFQEVAERRLIHSLPHRRSGLVLGLANIRGELLICVSLSRLLGLEKKRLPGDGQSARQSGEGLPGPEKRGAVAPRRGLFERLLVVNWEGSRLAFPVDEVHGILRFDSQELKEPPATVARSNVNYTQGILPWQGRAVGFLNAGALFPTLDRSLT